ncbi:hypothetical protein D3C80_1319610 [compost metagenome]
MRRTMRQLADAIPGMFRQAFNAPGFGEFRAVFREFNVLIARIGIRQRAHVAGTLHVVLPAHRVDAHVRLAKIPGQHREACQRAHGFHALIELCDAHAPQNRRGFCCGIHSRGLANLLRAHARDRFDRLRRIAFDNLAILFKPFGTAGDKRLVVQVFFNDDVSHRVEQGDV